MDLPLWDPFDDQGYPTSSNSNPYIGDHWLCDFYFGYGRDMIEEDAMNEKSCIQVLRILIGKADEEIVTLEEDIAMLQCQLAWDDEDWSEPCSAVLREKIEHLDVLIQSLKKEVTDDVRDFSIQLEQPEKLPQRLHDIVKPFLENYLVKSKQMENSISQATNLTAAGPSEKKSVADTSKSENKVEAKECITLLKTKQTKNLPVEPLERKINNHQQAADMTLESKIHCDKKMAEASIKIRAAKESRLAIDKNMNSTSPLVKAKGNRTKFAKIREESEAQATEMKDNDPDSLIGLFNRRKIPASMPKMKLETIQEKQIHEIESLVIGQTESIPPLKPNPQGTEKKCTAASAGEKLFLAAEVDMGSSSIGNLKGQQKFGASKKTSTNGEKETQQESSGTRIDGASEVTTTSISSPQRKRKLSLQTIRQKKGTKNWLMKLAEPDYDTANSTAWEARDTRRVEDMPQNPSACIADVAKLTLEDLKTIAENQKLTGYHKLRKEELKQRLGLVPQKNI